MVIKGQSDIEIHISDMGYITLKQRLDVDGGAVAPLGAGIEQQGHARQPPR